MTSPVTLTIREKIPRTNSNTVLVVPNLTYKNLILQTVDFETEEWSFEVSLKCAQTELVKLNPSYFQHSHSIDLSGHRAKLEEGDKVELYIKPKQSRKDIELMVCYTYTESEGAVYYQCSERLVDLNESTILVDLIQGMTPTRLYIKCGEPFSKVCLVPKFVGSEDVEKFEAVVVGGGGDCGATDSYEINFDNEELVNILPMLRYYQLKLESVGGNNFGADTQVHFMAKGYRF